MFVEQLQLRDFRNYDALTLALDAGINIFLGANAQGKTNIIEAVYFASLGHSHRTRTAQELIRWQQPSGSIQLQFQRAGVSQALAFQFVRGKRRRILLNGEPVRPKELVGHFNTVLFAPEDLYLIKGAPGERRRFLDGEISQASPAYYHELAQYNHLLQQRNTLLRKIRDHQAGASMLDLWDPQLIASGVKIIRKRQAAVQKFNMLANLMQRRISGNVENLQVGYVIHGWPVGTSTNELESWYNKELAKKRELDILRGTTSRGPHRDDLALTVNGIDLRTYGSQGQQRTGVLALKLAELEFLRSETGEYPVLLLDDVMSELDADRRQRLLAFICREHIQTLITATDGAYFPADGPGVFYQVQAGKVMGKR